MVELQTIITGKYFVTNDDNQVFVEGRQPFDFSLITDENEEFYIINDVYTTYIHKNGSCIENIEIKVNQYGNTQAISEI